VLPVQILAIGGASSLVTNAVGTVLMATGRTRALLGFGMGHFVAYGLAVLLVVPHGIAAVAVAAAIVHTVFLVFAYALMLRDSPENPLRRLWDDVAPAVVSCLGLAVVAVPVSLAVSSADAPAVLQLGAVGLLAVPAYLLALRLGFPAVWRSQSAIVDRILPGRRRPGRRAKPTAELTPLPVEPVPVDPGVHSAA